MNSMPSSSNSSSHKWFKYDVFISFRGQDTRKNFVHHLYHALMDKGLETYNVAEKIQKGDDLIKAAIEVSRFHIIVFSKDYASSSWCLDELVKITECHKMTDHIAYPVFYDVEPTEVRNQSGSVRKAFFKNKNKEAAEKWKRALKEAADLTGWELKNTLDGHTLINKIAQEISLINLGFHYQFVGMETRVRDVLSCLEMGNDDEVRMIGIKGMGGAGKTTLAATVFYHLYAEFECQSFVANVREVSNDSMFGLKNLQERVIFDMLNERVTVDGVTHGQNMMKERMHDKKVLLVLDDVDDTKQLEALVGAPKWFKPGSRILITTRDVQVLVAHRVNFIHDIDLLSDKEAISLFSRSAFGREIPSQGYEDLSRKVVRYAAGLPLTVKVLGSFLCGKDNDVWVDAIDRLKRIPLKETLENLELSYISLEDDYKEIFNDIACILKGERREYAIRVLECCGFHARNGLKVLEQKSFITVDECGFLRMHDHIEEMGKNIVRRSHPDEPNQHSRLWIDEEIEDILANDMGTKETRCLKIKMRKGDLRILMKGLGKMTNLRYLEVEFKLRYFDSSQLDESTKYFPNSIKYLRFKNYPFLYLPKTFQANNLVGIDMSNSKMVQLWEEGEAKVLQKLKFLALSESKLRTFDLGLTPNLEILSLDNCANFEELHVYVACPNLKLLNLRRSGLKSLDLELIPNLERLDLQECQLVKTNAPDGCLKKVVELNLRGCALLEKLPEDLGRFGCLKELDITDTGISDLPQSIFGLKGLLITASSKLLQSYDFPSEIKTTTGVRYPCNNKKRPRAYPSGE